MITRADIDTLASLARIGVSDEEKDLYAREIDSILAYVAEIQKVSSRSTGSADVAAPEMGVVCNVMRNDEDAHVSGEYTEKLLKEAPHREADFVAVKKILE